MNLFRHVKSRHFIKNITKYLNIWKKNKNLIFSLQKISNAVILWLFRFIFLIFFAILILLFFILFFFERILLFYLGLYS